VVVFVHLFILWGLIKQTGHIHLRDHKIVVETLILSPTKAPRSVTVSPSALVHKSTVKPIPTVTKPKISSVPQTTPTMPINQPPVTAPKSNPQQQTPPQATNHSTPAHSTTSPTIDTHYPCAAPNYPASARRNGEQGTVLLSFLINETGQVENSKVLQSSGSSALDTAALNALSQCHFKPATEDGHAIAIRVTIPYVWRLN